MKEEKILHLHVKKKYWWQVRNGKKKEEYRKHNNYWYERLCKSYTFIYYHLGYPRKNDLTKTLIFKWNGFKERFITHELFGKEKLVYVIPLGKPKTKSLGG